jgi:hypothetical protein
LGKSITLECSVNLHPTIVTSIKWLKKEIGMHKKKISLEIKELKFAHNNENYTCEVNYELPSGFKRAIRNSFLLKLNKST